MATLKSKERVQKFFKREPIDRMPCFSGMGTVVAPAIKKMGVKFAQVHKSSEYMAQSAMVSAEMFGFDGVVVPYDMATVAEALGRGITLYENSEDILYPTVPNKWPKLEDVQVPPDFMKRARMPVVDGAFKQIIADGRFALGGWVLGPFTLAGQVIELDLLLKGAKKYKDQVEAFLAKMTDITIECAKHYQELGADFINIREMGSGTDLLSPRMWKSLIQPNIIRIINALKPPRILHICGSTDMIVEMMNECGAEALSFDQKNTLADTRKKIGNNVILLGNYDPYKTLCQMENTADVENVIKKCIDNGADAVWPGCDIWPDVKPANLETCNRTIAEYGKKPTPAVGRL